MGQLEVVVARVTVPVPALTAAPIPLQPKALAVRLMEPTPSEVIVPVVIEMFLSAVTLTGPIVARRAADVSICRPFRPPVVLTVSPELPVAVIAAELTARAALAEPLAVVAVIVTVAAEMDPPLISKPLLLTPVPLDWNAAADSVELVNWTASPVSLATPVRDIVVPALIALVPKMMPSLSPVPPVHVADMVIEPVAVSVVPSIFSTSELPVEAVMKTVAAESVELNSSRPSPVSPAVPLRLSVPVMLVAMLMM